MHAHVCMHALHVDTLTSTSGVSVARRVHRSSRPGSFIKAAPRNLVLPAYPTVLTDLIQSESLCGVHLAESNRVESSQVECSGIKSSRATLGGEAGLSHLEQRRDEFHHFGGSTRDLHIPDTRAHLPPQLGLPDNDHMVPKAGEHHMCMYMHEGHVGRALVGSIKICDQLRFRVLGAVEGQRRREHGKEAHARAPHVGLRARVHAGV